MAIETITFNPQEIGLDKLIDHTQDLGYKEAVLACDQVSEIYGDFLFPPLAMDRPYLYASYVMSIDGKIAFSDDERGPLIAKNNYLDPLGATADFWVLNLLRASCDAIIIGAGTLSKEPDYSGSTYDPTLLEARKEAKKPLAPWTVVVSRRGKDIPFKNPVFNNPDIPILIATTPAGLEAVKKDIDRPWYLLSQGDEALDEGQIKSRLEAHQGQVAILVTGGQGQMDDERLLQILRLMGIKKALVESPAYTHHLMEKHLLDEVFINTSCLFVGGKASSIGMNSPSFKSTDHPHARLVSMHTHDAHFFYVRYQMIYGIKKTDTKDRI